MAGLLHLQSMQPRAAHALHQPDWIAGGLCGRFGIADENNVLKLAYDIRMQRWPDWFDALGVRRELLPKVAPKVVPAGTPIGLLDASLARD